MAGYYITPQAFDSTALAQLQQGGLTILNSINNDQGQDTVIDIATTPNQKLFGFRGWGSAAELLTFNAQGETIQSKEIFVSTGEAFALVVDNQKKWFFVATSHNSSALYVYENSSYTHIRDFSFVVVGAAGLE